MTHVRYRHTSNADIEHVMLLWALITAIDSMNNTKELREHGKFVVDWIADYWKEISHRRVIADVQPGFMASLLPSQAPQHADDFDQVFQDLESMIMPGVRHRKYKC